MAPLLLAACGASVTPSASPAQISSSTSDDGFRLTLTLPVDTAVAGEPIPLTTTVAYLGPADSIEFQAAATEWVGHGIRSFGDRATHGPWGFNLDCSTFDLKRGEVKDIPFRLATDVSPGDPNAAMIESAWDTGRLRLPAGLWAIDAAFRYYDPGCDTPERWIGATVYVTVR